MPQLLPPVLLLLAAAAGCSLDAVGVGDGSADGDASSDEHRGDVDRDGRDDGRTDGGDLVEPDDGDDDGDAAETVACTEAGSCDDGIPCTQDWCDGASGTCRHFFLEALCDDGVACTQDVCNFAAARCDHIPRLDWCDDRDRCTGEERCDAETGCVAGAEVDCDDHVDCTVDSCDPVTGDCSSVPIDAQCDDGQFCNGRESCEPASGCVPGAAPTCDDRRDCTADYCDGAAAAGLGACVFIPLDLDGDTYTDAACDGEDCDDADRFVHPGAVDVCNGIDDNCSGLADDAPGACPGCAVRWFGGHTYQFCTGPVRWGTARDACAARSGYYLSTVGDADENDWLSTTARSFAVNAWWIGFSDSLLEGTWVWLLSPSTYLNWAPGEPNDDHGDEDCALIDFYFPATGWNDADCYRVYPYVCEHE